MYFGCLFTAFQSKYGSGFGGVEIADFIEGIGSCACLKNLCTPMHRGEILREFYLDPLKWSHA